MIGILDEDGNIVYVVPELGPGDVAAHGVVENVPDEFLRGEVVWNGEAFIPNLSRIEAQLLAQLNNLCEAILGSHTDTHVGLSFFRAEKRRELQLWDAAGTDRVVNAQTFPFIVAEAAVRGVTPATVIEEVRIQVQEWATAGAQLEAFRVAGRAAIRSAADRLTKLEAFEAARAAILGVGGA